MASQPTPEKDTGNTSRSTQRDEDNTRANKGKGIAPDEEGPKGRIPLIEAMRKRVEHEEKNQKRRQFSTERKTCRFGKTILPIRHPEDPESFRPLDYLPIDQQQQSLLDSIWTARTRKQKLDACCALQYYFSKIMEPPQGKNFSYYALSNGPNKGVYCYYSSLLQAKDNLQHPHFKGFYSFTDALNFVWDNCYNKDAQIYLEEEPRDGPMIANYQVELRSLREQINDLITEITELKKPPTEDMDSEPIIATARFAEELLKEASDDRRNPRTRR